MNTQWYKYKAQQLARARLSLMTEAQKRKQREMMNAYLQSIFHMAQVQLIQTAPVDGFRPGGIVAEQQAVIDTVRRKTSEIVLNS